MRELSIREHVDSINPEKLIFALDVGTRSIIGLVCVQEGENIRVLEIAVTEHPERHMIDGQIHNIREVAKTVKNVKEHLENQLQIKLEQVSIAAAGRSLKTIQIKVEREIDPEEKVLPEEIITLEMEGVNKAQEELCKSEGIKPNDYYCVGYTTAQYMLEGQPISSLLSQKGSSMGAVILATFLPHAVVESLLTVVEEVGLSLHSMTLEPIAALQALIPPEYRMLNLALVDIGAGTSDIAITNKGSVIAYAMVPLAGDEITEKLLEYYLLDFHIADNLKKQLSTSKPHYTFQDIIGNNLEATWEELMAIIEPALDDLVEKISQAILHYNQTSPSAVFCVGGSSQIPLLREKISARLNVPMERVAIRDFNALKRFIYYGKELRGPECVTPMGIALSALNEKFFGFSYITINSKVVRLMETEPISVGKSLIIAGFNPRHLIGLRGPSTKVNINGREKIFPGYPGENAVITINGETASLETIVRPNDEIRVKPAVPGTPALITVKHVLEQDENHIYFKGKRIKITPRITVNGEQAGLEHLISSGDVIITDLGTIEDFAKNADIDLPPRAMVNGEVSDYKRRLRTGDRIDWDNSGYLQ